MSKQQISSAAVHVITGTLSDDPTQWATRSGVSMVVFTMKVVHRKGKEYLNTYYRIKTFGALADACLAHLHEERLVQAMGHDMNVWAYIDKGTGEPRGIMELVAPSVVFLDQPWDFGTLQWLPDGDIPFAPVVDETEPMPQWADPEFEVPAMAIN